jgi:hypothetical protein
MKPSLRWEASSRLHWARESVYTGPQRSKVARERISILEVLRVTDWSSPAVSAAITVTAD